MHNQKDWRIVSRYKKGVDIVEAILKKRDITDIDEFLNPPSLNTHFQKLSASFKSSLKDAVKLVRVSIKKDIPIIIHGDYDADGICATAILYNTFTCELGYANTHYFIPNRFKHSYGVTDASVDAALEAAGGPKEALFITVDNGITAVEAIEYIKKLGHKIILTDHHQKPKKLPKCDVLVWNDAVVGASLSWLLSKALGSKNKQSISLAALATVTDIQPVLGFNRTILTAGLKVLNAKPPRGIAELLQLAGRRGEITTYELGWVIGPRINATGRLIDANEAVRLFVEQDPGIVRDVAFKLHQINAERQTKTQEMYGLASEFGDEPLPRVLISADPAYHEGIIGLVAARLMQKYNRPAIVISVEDDYSKGSVRSVPGVDIIAFLRLFEDVFENVGGHPGAAGFTIKTARIDELRAQVNSHVEEHVLDEHLVPELVVDMEMPLSVVTLRLAQQLEKLRPFGVGNYEPVFVSRGLRIASADKVGRDGQHISLKLYENGDTVKAIWFGGAEAGLDFNMGDIVDIAYTLQVNEFGGRKSVDLVVKDLRLEDL